MTTPNRAVYNAWNNPDINQKYSVAARERLRKEWPALAAALDLMPMPSDDDATMLDVILAFNSERPETWKQGIRGLPEDQIKKLYERTLERVAKEKP